jgi:hypothetical protein
MAVGKGGMVAKVSRLLEFSMDYILLRTKGDLLK